MLGEARDLIEPLTRQGEDAIWRSAEKALIKLAAVRAILATQPSSYRKALEEADALLAELIAKPKSRDFWGIGVALSSKLGTIHLTIKSALGSGGQP